MAATRLTSQMDLSADLEWNDARAVRVREGDTKVTVQIDDPFESGDRATELGTIMVQRGANWTLRLTWLEARKLAAALNEVVDIAELG